MVGDVNKCQNMSNICKNKEYFVLKPKIKYTPLTSKQFSCVTDGNAQLLLLQFNSFQCTCFKCTCLPILCSVCQHLQLVFKYPITQLQS